jgi:hypothetical protein
LKNPIRVCAGEKIAEIGPTAKDASLQALGPFVHVEVFSADAILTAAGWTQVTVGSVDDLAEPQEASLQFAGQKAVVPST